MNKEEITVSAEVKTYLMDLYSQIEYELQEQYNDEVQKLQQENKKYKEVIDKLNIRIKENKKNIDESGSFVETYTGWKLIPEILDELLDILKEVE